MDEKPFLVAKDAGWLLGDRWVLKDISLALRPHEFFAIMGPNGCGKTSLLKMLAGLIFPTHGSVAVRAPSGGFEVVTRVLHQQQGGAAFVFDSGGLVSSLSVFDNLALPLRYHRVLPEAQICKQVEGLIAEFGLDSHVEDWPAHLSVGLRKRVQLARAKLIRPRVVFYDDPELGLDPGQGVFIHQQMEALHGKGERLSVVVTRDWGWVMEAADRVAVVDGGKLAAVGRPKDLKANPPLALREFLKKSFF